jgi:hypothetical protein
MLIVFVEFLSVYKIAIGLWVNAKKASFVQQRQPLAFALNEAAPAVI